jgi:hypothetical protein
MIESVIFNGVTYTPAEFAIFAAANPEAFLPPAAPEPTLAALKAMKSAEIEAAYVQALAVGVEAMPEEYPGALFSIQQVSLGRFLSAIMTAEMAGQANIPVLYLADDSKLESVPMTTARAGYLTCWNAAFAVDAVYRERMLAIEAATNQEDLEAITW